MRILIAGQSYHPAFNGQAIFTTNLAEGLAKHGHKIIVLAPSYRGSPYQYERNGVLVECIRSMHLKWLHPGIYFSPYPSGRIKKVVSRFQPEIVHIQDHYPISYFAYKHASAEGVKIVGTNHFMPENMTPYLPFSGKFNKIYRRVLWSWMQALYNHLDVVIAPSKTAISILCENGLKAPAFAISCGIDSRYFHPDPELNRRIWRQLFDLDPDRITFLFVGRVDFEKRLDVVLKAMVALRRDDVQLAIAGTGAAQEELSRLAQKLNLNGHVKLLGYVDEHHLPALINCADIFVMPSEAELLSIATLEAMSCGLPILAARAGALPELVTEGVNGYLFRAGDVFDAASRMNWLADHPKEWSELGQSSLLRAKQHEMEKILQSYEMLYVGLLARGILFHEPSKAQPRPTSSPEIRRTLDSI